MTLDELLNTLQITPVTAEIHPVSTCFLPGDVAVLKTEGEAVALLDRLEVTPPTRMLITSSDPLVSGRFAYVHCDHDPFTPQLNSILINRFDDIADRMLLQSQLASRILAQAKKADLVILLLIDGLSYRDVQSWKGEFQPNCTIEPCLVDAPTLTRLAFPNIVGSPSIAVRAVGLGFDNRLGFSYWTREENELTNQLFFGIADTTKVGAFSPIAATVRSIHFKTSRDKYFIQIIRTGLDGYAHSQRRRPPVDAIINDIRQEFEQLAEICGNLGRHYSIRARMFLAADHGILWRDEFEPMLVAQDPVTSSPRWCTWRELHHQREIGRRFDVNGEEFYCLGYPMLRRPLRIDEQGVHGGISYEESIVPFITVRFGD